MARPPVNEKTVARYPDERAVHRELTIKRPIATVLDGAGQGQPLALLKRGAPVTQLAERSGFSLVRFVDASAAPRELLGWVKSEVFTAEPRRAPMRLACLAGNVPLLLATGDDMCVRACARDADCEASTVCAGRGVLSQLGENGGSVQFCVAKPSTLQRDAGEALP